jgi:hypothetical protein
MRYARFSIRINHIKSISFAQRWPQLIFPQNLQRWHEANGAQEIASPQRLICRTVLHYPEDVSILECLLLCAISSFLFDVTINTCPCEFRHQTEAQLPLCRPSLFKADPPSKLMRELGAWLLAARSQTWNHRAARQFSPSSTAS